MTTNTGILGAFTGTIGPVTAYMRNGKNVLRTRRSSVKTQRTPLQVAQREKICISNQFARAFRGTGFFNTSFPAYGQTNTGVNRVTSALMSLAVTGVYPNMQLNYQQVLVSKGRLPGAQNANATANNGALHFSFKDNSTDGIAAANDTLILVAYASDLQQAIFTLYGGLRKDKKAVLNVAALKGYAVETWIGFLSADEKDTSDSVWTGRMVV